MRLPDHAHTDRPWRIHEITGDFTLEDVWALPTPGGPDDFDRLVRNFTSGDPSLTLHGLPGLLWAARWRLGSLLGWDRAESGLGTRVATLRDRLPEDLRAGPAGPEFASLPFRSVYLTENEYAAEIANQTVHAVLHLGWVPDGEGYSGQMAVLVRPNGLVGRVYMAGIAPLRHLVVYPQLMQNIRRGWPADRVPDRMAEG